MTRKLARDLEIIDIHTHIGHLPGAVGDVYTAKDLVHIAENEGVSFMLASSASATTISQAAGTRETLAMVEEHGGRLGGMLWINPHDPDWRQDVPAAIEHGFYGIKIHPVLDHYVVDRAALDDVFAVAATQGWPILTHTDVDGTPMSANAYEPLIRAYPEVPLILAHLRLEAIPLAKRYDNVYLDTTYVTPAMVEIGVDALGPEKILFGSDACEGFDVGRTPGRVRPRRSYAGLVDGLRQRGIGDASLNQILSANARDLFDIDCG
jgi:predicted TIM-barrel fold metal-dependent hydrolase